MLHVIKPKCHKNTQQSLRTCGQSAGNMRHVRVPNFFSHYFASSGPYLSRQMCIASIHLVSIHLFQEVSSFFPATSFRLRSELTPTGVRQTRSLKYHPPANSPAGTALPFRCILSHFLDYPSEHCLFLYVNTSKCRSAEIISISSHRYGNQGPK